MTSTKALGPDQMPPQFLLDNGQPNQDHILTCVDLWQAGARSADPAICEHPWRILSCAPVSPIEAAGEASLDPAHARRMFSFDPMLGRLYALPRTSHQFEARAREYTGDDITRRDPVYWANQYNARIANRAIVGEIIGGHRVLRVGISGTKRSVIRMDRLVFCLTYGTWPTLDTCVTALYPPQLYDKATMRALPVQFPYGVLRMTDTLKPDLLLYTHAHIAQREGKRVML